MTRTADLPDDVADLAVEYVHGTLSAAEGTAFEARLAADPALAAEVVRLRRALGLLPLATATPAPPALRARVLEAAERKLRAARAATPDGTNAVAPAPRPEARREPADPPSTPRPATVVPFPAPRTPRRIVWSRFAAAAAAGLAVMFAADAWRVRRELALERTLVSTLQEPNVVHTFRLASTGGGDAYGRVALDMDAKRGAVVVSHLPALPAGQVYRLWAQVGDKAILCGQFGSTPEGAVQAQFVVPVESYTAPIGELYVTVEPTGAPPVPTGPRVMQSA